MAFTLCRLDRKFRLVIPLSARNRLGIGDLVKLRVQGNRIIVTRADENKASEAGFRPVSKNQLEVGKWK
jgi:AbrB family looped-hinge helix DNA binding protein